MLYFTNIAKVNKIRKTDSPKNKFNQLFLFTSSLQLSKRSNTIGAMIDASTSFTMRMAKTKLGLGTINTTAEYGALL